MTEPTTYTKVDVVGIAQRDAFPGPNYAFITLRVGDNQYYDFVCNEDGPLDAFRAVAAGTLCRIQGKLGKRKIKGAQPPTRYEIQLVAERIDIARGQAAPPPPQRRPPQQDFSTWQRGTPQRTVGGAPVLEHPQERQKEHPAQFDADDQLWEPA